MIISKHTVCSQSLWNSVNSQQHASLLINIHVCPKMHIRSCLYLQESPNKFTIRICLPILTVDYIQWYFFVILFIASTV